MQLYGSFQKLEETHDGTIIVEGIASSEAVDADGEVMCADAIKAAIPEYMKFANVREMHQNKAAGVALDVWMEGNLTKIKAHIIDRDAIAKIKGGVYKGFSVGGKILKRDEYNKKLIKAIKLSEISLVDRPCNAQAVFEVWKGEDMKPAPEAAQEGEPKATETEVAKVETAEAPKEEAKTEQAAEPVKPEEGASEKADKPDDLKKGMWDVKNLADAIDNLRYLCSNAEFESQIEGDNSQVPAMLKGALVSLIAAFKAMASEEANEVAADVGAEAAKAAGVEDLQKIEARIMASVDERLAKVGKINEDLAKENSLLKVELEELKKLPAAPKGVTKAVSKAEDNGAQTVETQKADTPVDMIKMIHSQGGHRLFSA